MQMPPRRAHKSRPSVEDPQSGKSPIDAELSRPITLTCAICGEEIARSSVAPFHWVHKDDYVHLPTLRTDYDHEATPLVIESTLTSEGRQEKIGDRDVTRNPFEVITPKWAHKAP